MTPTSSNTGRGSSCARPARRHHRRSVPEDQYGNWKAESADSLCDLLILVEEASGAVTAPNPEFVEIDHFVGQWWA